MRQPALELAGGFHVGPLFVVILQRPRVRRMSGGKEVWAKYSRAKPPWTSWKECNVFWERSAQATRETGIQHSVDHIVPLRHPLVCGLHTPANLAVTTLAANIRKSNNWWPDMWNEQLELFNVD